MAIRSQPAIVTLADAALFLHIPTRTLRRWTLEGRITRYGTPRELRVDLHEAAAVRQPGRARAA